MTFDSTFILKIKILFLLKQFYFHTLLIDSLHITTSRIIVSLRPADNENIYPFKTSPQIGKLIQI